MELLTTGQMIDRLKVGEVAERSDKKWNVSWDKEKLVFKFLENGGGRDRIYLSDVEKKWNILPKYVSFNGAMEALKEGKEVWFHHEACYPVLIQKEITLKRTDLGSYTLSEIYNGKFTIE